MSLQNLLNLSTQKNKKQGISEQRVLAQLDNIRYLISFYRQYPDLLIDFIKGPDSKFKFYFYHRIFLRIVMRHRYTFATFPRAYSKSFLSMMALILRCILYPNSELFITKNLTKKKLLGSGTNINFTIFCYFRAEYLCSPA